MTEQHSTDEDLDVRNDEHLTARDPAEVMGGPNQPPEGSDVVAPHGGDEPADGRRV